MRRVSPAPGLQAALRAERARLRVGEDAAELEPAREHGIGAPGRCRIRAAQEGRLDAVDDHALVGLAIRGRGQEPVARHQQRDGVRDPQFREPDPGARRERRRVVPGEAPQRFRRARRVAAGEGDLGLEALLFARIGCRDGRDEVPERGLGGVRFRAQRPLAGRRQPEPVRLVSLSAARRGLVGARRGRMVALAREALGPRGVAARPAARSRARQRAGGEERAGQEGGGGSCDPEFRLHRRRPLARISRPPAAVGEDIL
jgi:hypothetical protein